MNLERGREDERQMRGDGGTREQVETLGRAQRLSHHRILLLSWEVTSLSLPGDSAPDPVCSRLMWEREGALKWASPSAVLSPVLSSEKPSPGWPLAMPTWLTSPWAKGTGTPHWRALGSPACQGTTVPSYHLLRFRTLPTPRQPSRLIF